MKHFTVLFFSLLFLLSGCQKPDEDACQSMDCQNGGSCINNGVCACPNSFYGPNCEHHMNGFSIDSIVVECNTIYGPSGNLIEGPGEGDLDLSLELFYESFRFNTIHTSIVNYEVPISTESTFYPNWNFSTGAFLANYRLNLNDYDAVGSLSSYTIVREVYFQFQNREATASQTVTTADGQFSATMYYSYQ